MKKATSPVYIFKKRTAAKFLPQVSITDNKATRGRSLILAGSPDYPGAGILSAQGAQRMGSGYVILAQKSIPAALLEHPDFLLADLNKKSWREIPCDAILIGPGFGVTKDTAKIIRELKAANKEKVVIDADALTVCANEDLFPLPATWIATPHVGELARCLKISSEEINADRAAAILKAQVHFGCVVLLKGHGTLVINQKRIYSVASGNSALAKAGTGDVLAGMITALRAQGMPATRAALLGAYVHGATASLWHSQKRDLLAMTALDVLQAIPRVLYLLRRLNEKTSQ
ncbi:MAG: NAD(P)H-hydrate dehydratase [Bdellovibrio sp.]|nr:NAD(P)H-hydrate dehydratase [Bdellovibrio sp.]